VTTATLPPTDALAAVLLGCSARQIWRLIDLGRELGVYRLGRLVRFTKSIVDALLGGDRTPGRA